MLGSSAAIPRNTGVSSLLYAFRCKEGARTSQETPIVGSKPWEQQTGLLAVSKRNCVNAKVQKQCLRNACFDELWADEQPNQLVAPLQQQEAENHPLDSLQCHPS
jgi:hypothetical protein